MLLDEAATRRKKIPNQCMLSYELRFLAWNNQKRVYDLLFACVSSTLKKVGLSTPNSLPNEWVVDCTYVGKGLSALKFLSRYLYRGVISENNIVSNRNGNATFKYVENRTGKIRYRTLKGEDFL